ncbi:flavin reductase family protein [Candidatus Beckwithbacteria bacterium]|nr:flavin reductase family protein [Candidatus Beckwithbacteria bacterium]
MLKKTSIKLALQKFFPEPLALVVSKEPKGRVNFCPVGYFSIISHDPKIWVVGLYEKHFSSKVIKQSKEYVLCLPSLEQANDVLYCGSVHGWKVDKTKETKFKLLPASKIKTPLIDASIACYECKVVKTVKIGDHLVFFGKIVAAHTSNKNWQKKLYNLDNKNLGSLNYILEKATPISYLPEGED